MYGMSEGGYGRRPDPPPRNDDDNDDGRQLRGDEPNEEMIVYSVDDDSDDDGDEAHDDDDEHNHSSGQDDSDDDVDDDDDDDDDDDTAMAEDAAATGAATAAPPAAGAAPAGGDDGGAVREEEDGGGSADASSSSAVANGGVIVVKAVSNLDRLHDLREMGREALCWQLSSAKPGNGVEQIREPTLDTYWQSDGTAQPHWIQVTFGRRVAMSHVCLYLDYAQDESYTPRRIQVQVGMTDQDLGPAIHPPLTQIELQEPSGWCIIPLSSPPDPLDDVCSPSTQNVVRAHLLRISILSMHQNGRDTHVRQVQIYGPRLADGSSSSAPPNPQESAGGRPNSGRAAFHPASFRTVEASMFSSVR